jgi:ABC-type lipoprotein release transport system permease subunit
MAWRNIWRNPRRTLLTIAAISFACILLVFMLSFQLGSYDTMINASVKIHTGHLQIQAEGYQASQKIRDVIPDPARIGAILDKIPQVTAYTYRAMAFALVSSKSRSYGVMVEGIDPRREARVSTLADIIRQGHYLTAAPPGDAPAGALVGRLLAQNLRLKVGDEITVLGQGRDGSIAATVLHVQGIYASGMDAFDRGTIQIPLSVFQQVFSMGGAVHEVVVLARNLKSVPAIEKRLSGRLKRLATPRPLVVLDWKALTPGLDQAIKMDLVSGSIFYLILIMVVAFSILNTFLMAIFERTHEFGVMMAMGTRPGRLTRLVLFESIGMTLVGVVAGIVLGTLITWYFMIHGIDLGASSNEIMRQFGIPSRFFPQLSVVSATVGPGAVFVITLLAALYPALKIRRLRPVEAIQHV